MIPERGRQALLALLGVGAGVAAGVWLYRLRTTRRGTTARGWSEPRGSAQEVAEALRQDDDLSRRAIEVDSIAEGVVELGGSVHNRDEAVRAVRIAQDTTGVFTVVNRLAVEAEESQRESTRRRWNDGAPELRERQHYGMGVGMGTRRQSPDTDPDRPNDRQRMIERDLEVRNVADEPEAGPDPVPAPGAVESERVKPGDEEAIREAGLEAEHGPAPTPESADGDGVGEETGGPGGEEER
jgi:hypothetical protein